MDFSRLSYEQINGIADQLSSKSESMRDLLEQITNLFNRIGDDGVWSGTAASATKAEFDTLSAKFPEFSQAINDCCVYLRQVVANYQAVDAAVQGQQ